MDEGGWGGGAVIPQNAATQQPRSYSANADDKTSIIAAATLNHHLPSTGMVNGEISRRNRRGKKNIPRNLPMVI